MDITRSFNAAASGNGGPDPIDQGENPRRPTGQGPHSASASVDPSVSVEHARADLSADFNSPAQPVWWEDPDIDEEETGETRSASVDNAKAELGRLELGRAEPYLENNLRPAGRLEQAVHTNLEDERAFRIAALKTYLGFASELGGHAATHARNDDLEFSL